MANLMFPQLSSGAIAQYPIRKARVGRSIKNVLPDGSMILLPDPNATRLIWQLEYTNLASGDVDAINSFFAACEGRLHAFTFIDPVDNMLVNSANLSGSSWQASSLIQLSSGATDPNGGSGAFTVTNTGQASQQISQSLSAPADYTYSFSIYAMSMTPGAITLVRSGSTTQQTTTISIGPQWTRAVSSGALVDEGTTLSVGISLAAGQQLFLYGPQLDAQPAPSEYRTTNQIGGVYLNAHFDVDELPISVDAPNLYSTAFSIETSI